MARSALLGATGCCWAPHIACKQRGEALLQLCWGAAAANTPSHLRSQACSANRQISQSSWESQPYFAVNSRASLAFSCKSAVALQAARPETLFLSSSASEGHSLRTSGTLEELLLSKLGCPAFSQFSHP